MLDTKTIIKQFPYLQEVINLRVENNSGIKREGVKRIFLDNTASTQLPAEVLEKIASSLFQYANIHRGEYDASRQTSEDFERAYNITANLVNADSWREIIFGRNATEMINLVMRAMAAQFNDGDNIVLTRLEHNSNYVPWHALQQNLRRDGKEIEIRIADFDRNAGQIDASQLERLIDAHTKLVTVTGASNFLGTKPELKKIGEIAHSSRYRQPDGSRGSYFLVDGAQLVPSCPVGVQEMDCDFLAWSFHKMTLPVGVGALYGRQKILESLDPFLFGGDMVEEVHEGEVKYKPLPWKYTAGTPNILGTIAVGAGISFLVNLGLGETGNAVVDFGNKIVAEVLMNTPRGDFEIKYVVPPGSQDLFGEFLARHPEVNRDLRDPEERLAWTRKIVHQAMSNINQHEQELVQYALDGLSDIPQVQIYGPLDAQKRCGLVAFNIRGKDHQAAAFQLNQRGVEVRNGLHCAALAHNYLGIPGSVRMGFYVYNTKEEVAQAVDAVAEIARK